MPRPSSVVAFSVVASTTERPGPDTFNQGEPTVAEMAYVRLMARAAARASVAKELGIVARTEPYQP
jgi:hypothetical protein